MNNEFINIVLNTIIAFTAILGISSSLYFSKMSMKELINQKELQYRPLIRQMFHAKHSEQLQKLLTIQNIGSGYAINVRFWWKISEFNHGFWDKSITEEIIPLGIMGIDEKVDISFAENAKLFNTIDEYCRINTDRIHQLNYIIMYVDIFEKIYIYEAQYKLHYGKISLISHSQMPFSPTKEELLLIGDN